MSPKHPIPARVRTHRPAWVALSAPACRQAVALLNSYCSTTVFCLRNSGCGHLVNPVGSVRFPSLEKECSVNLGEGEVDVCLFSFVYGDALNYYVTVTATYSQQLSRL